MALGAVEVWSRFYHWRSLRVRFGHSLLYETLHVALNFCRCLNLSINLGYLHLPLHPMQNQFLTLILQQWYSLFMLLVNQF
ncbi:MAG: hypothetical protein DSM106950_45565, partial [Stigonema ocellatum SAG 48.90 = DSM 106950]|nr:hypothetical protein [Stigonema ocellatum SAG 48.90 = DSM 106950]